MNRILKNIELLLLIIWEFARKRPLLFLALVLGVQTLFTLDVRALWFSDEVRHTNVMENLAYHGKWWVLYLNGEPYPDKPPVYFWFIYLIYPFFGRVTPALMFFSAVVSAYLFVLSAYFLARRVMKTDVQTALLSGLTILTGFYFIALSHYSRMDFLFSALIILSHILLYLGIVRDRPNLLTILGFMVIGFAGLTKGQFGVAFPVFTLLLYLFWTKNLKRAFRPDVIGGFIIMLFILFAWVGGVIYIQGWEYLKGLVYKQIYQRSMATWHHQQPFYHYLLTFPLAWLPWTLILPVLPLKRLLAGDFWRDGFQAGRAGGGLVWVWTMLLGGFTLLSVMSMKIVVYLLPLFAPLSIVTARAFLELPEERKIKAQGYVGILTMVAGFLAVGFKHVLPRLVDLPPLDFLRQEITKTGVHFFYQAISGTEIVAVILLLGGGLLFVFRRADFKAWILMLAIAYTAFIWPAAAITAPSLDKYMSPREQGLRIGEYVKKGYSPFAFEIYSGIYTHYAGVNIPEYDDFRLLGERIGAASKAVVVMRRKHWDAWPDKPQNLKIIDESWLVDRYYVIAAKD